MTIVPYANSLDLDETHSNVASHPDPSCLTLGQYFHNLLSNIEALYKIEADEKNSRQTFNCWAKGYETKNIVFHLSF